jgi:cell division protein ZipA
MQTSWSLGLNILLLIGVIIAISRMIKARRQNSDFVDYQPSIGTPTIPTNDDIIAVRKVNLEPVIEEPAVQPILRPTPHIPATPSINRFEEEEKQPSVEHEPASSLMMFLLAKENRQLAGYELLQTVLAAGLRFGEGHLFHRHQSPNGQGPVLCSLAAATPTGVFDLQNIGAFSVHGLCLFMQASGNPTIDAERFAIMLDTAKQLSEGLDTHLLDDRRQPMSDASVQRYYRLLNLGEVCDVA